MRDSSNVISEAVDGYVKQLAMRREVSLARMYQLLGDDCVYSKSKRLIRDIAAVNHAGYELVKADLLALFDELDGDAGEVSIAEMSQELHDPLQAKIEAKPKDVRLRECREGIKVLSREIQALEQEDKPLVRRVMAEKVAEVHERRNGRK